MNEAPKKKQKMRFSDDELALVKTTFADNDALIIQLRKRFLQFPLTESEQKNLVATFPKGSSAEKVLFKFFNPVLDPEAPIYQVTDMWLNVEIKDKHTDLAIPYIYAREKLCGYLDFLQANFTDFDPSKSYKFTLDSLLKLDGKTETEIHTDILTRNAIVGHVEAHLNQAYLLAGRKEETVQQTTDRLSRDSAK